MGDDVRMEVDRSYKSVVLPSAHVPSTSQSSRGTVYVPVEILAEHRHDATQRAVPPPGRRPSTVLHRLHYREKDER